MGLSEGEVGVLIDPHAVKPCDGCALRGKVPLYTRSMTLLVDHVIKTRTTRVFLHLFVILASFDLCDFCLYTWSTNGAVDWRVAVMYDICWQWGPRIYEYY